MGFSIPVAYCRNWVEYFGVYFGVELVVFGFLRGWMLLVGVNLVVFGFLRGWLLLVGVNLVGVVWDWDGISLRTN